MKKFLALMLALVMALSLVACGSKPPVATAIPATATVMPTPMATRSTRSL